MIKTELPLVVATYNIRGWGKEQHDGVNAWENRKKLTRDVIKKLGADLLGLQEFSAADNAKFYKDNLPRYKLFLGSPVDNGWSNPIIYNPRKLKLIKNETIWLNRNDEPAPDWGAKEIRSANLVVFEYRRKRWKIWEKLKRRKHGTSARNIVAVNAHLDNDNPLAWVEGTKKILEKVEPYTRPPYSYPIVVFGDFNTDFSLSNAKTSSSASPYDLFLKAGFQEAFMATHPDMAQNPPYTFHDFPGGHYSRYHMDWIMGKGFTSKSCEVVYEASKKQPPLYSSDHFAKRAELKLV